MANTIYVRDLLVLSPPVRKRSPTLRTPETGDSVYENKENTPTEKYRFGRKRRAAMAPLSVHRARLNLKCMLPSIVKSIRFCDAGEERVPDVKESAQVSLLRKLPR